MRRVIPVLAAASFALAACNEATGPGPVASIASTPPAPVSAAVPAPVPAGFRQIDLSNPRSAVIGNFGFIQGGQASRAGAFVLGTQASDVRAVGGRFPCLGTCQGSFRGMPLAQLEAAYTNGTAFLIVFTDGTRAMVDANLQAI